MENKIKNLYQKDINFWVKCLKQALKSGDTIYAVHCNEMINLYQLEIDRERVIEEIQKINCNQRNNIYELAILDNKELSERLNELTKTKLNEIN